MKTSFTQFCILLLLLTFLTAADRVVAAKEIAGLALGDSLPDFSLPGVDGKQHTRAEYDAHKVLALVFTSNHCPASQAYEERLLKLDADYRDKGVKLIALMSNNARGLRLAENRFSDVDDTFEGMKIRAKDMKFTFPYLYDGETQALGRAVGARATPHLFLFDSERKLRYSGGIDNSPEGKVTRHWVREALEDLLAGRQVATAKTRTFGCSTKWLEKEAHVKAEQEKWDLKPVSSSAIDDEQLKKLVAGDGENHILINVWAPWCVSCIDELPDLVKLHRIYSTRSIKVISLGLGKKDSAHEILAKAHAAEMTNLFYEGEIDKAAEALDSQWEGPVPYTVLINAEGKIVYRKEGPFDMLTVRREIVDRIGRTRTGKPRKSG